MIIYKVSCDRSLRCGMDQSSSEESTARISKHFRAFPPWSPQTCADPRSLRWGKGTHGDALTFRHRQGYLINPIEMYSYANHVCSKTTYWHSTFGGICLESSENSACKQIPFSSPHPPRRRTACTTPPFPLAPTYDHKPN